VQIVPYPSAMQVYEQRLLKFDIGAFWRTVRGAATYHRFLMQFFRDAQPQILWADNIRTFTFLYLAGKRSGCKIILNIWSEPQGKVAWLLHRLCLLLADQVHTEYRGQIPKVFGRLAGVRPLQQKIFTLYSGVTDFEERSSGNVREELQLSPSDLLVIMAGNISVGKGQLDLIRAVERLVTTFPHLHLLLAGRPVETRPESMAYDARLREHASAAHVVDHVHFLGWRSDIPDLLQAADVYVSTSYSESLPDAMRDAMRAGKPIVGSDAGGTSELVRDGECGFLFEPGDVDALIGCLSRLLQDAPLRQAMGEEGQRIIAERFSTEVYVRRFEETVMSIA
jgi:glycosyltransferase involved in cell wall biosynthesis